jgi:hypothetical protein
LVKEHEHCLGPPKFFDNHPTLFDISTLFKSEYIVWFKSMNVVEVFKSFLIVFQHSQITFPWVLKMNALFGSKT